MTRNKKLSEDELMRVVGSPEKQYKTILWHSRELVIAKSLTVKEYLDTVNRTIEMCSSENGDVAVEMIDFAIRINTIAALANIEMPKDIDTLFYIAYSSDLYDTVRGVCSGIAAAIRKSVYMCLGDRDEQ